jgi:hypothetical protein
MRNQHIACNIYTPLNREGSIPYTHGVSVYICTFKIYSLQSPSNGASSFYGSTLPPALDYLQKKPLQIGTDRCGEHVGSGEDDGKRKVALREAGECGSDDVEGTEVMTHAVTRRTANMAMMQLIKLLQLIIRCLLSPSCN